jgi:hypothetical protein
VNGDLEIRAGQDIVGHVSCFRRDS